MTLLFVEGFDWTNTGADLADYQKWYDTPYLSLSSSYGRYGGNGACFTANGRYMRKNLPLDTYGTITIGCAYRPMQAGSPSLANKAYPMLGFYDSSFVQQIALMLDPTGYIYVYNGAGTQLGVSTNNNFWEYQRWFYIELKVYIHDSAGTVTVKVDGVTEIDESSKDTKYGNDYISFVRYSVAYDGLDIYFDDLYITDGDFLGDVRVKTYMPDSDGAHSMFTPSTPGDHYAMVDETAGIDGDTTYIESATLNAKDSFGITPTIANVLGVQVTSVNKRSGTAKVKMKNLIRSGGSDYNSSNEEELYINYRCFSSIHETDPDDSNPWTQTKVSNAEFGVEITAITTTTTTSTTSTTTTTA